VKKRHLAKRRLQLESLEQRLTMSAMPALHVPAAVAAQMAGMTPTVITPSIAKAIRQAAPKANNVVVSYNWSGVEVANPASAPGGDATQAIQAEWIVPKVVSRKYAGTMSNWIGIGGGIISNGGNLVQLGTQETVDSTGIYYSAWWEVVNGPDDTKHEVPLDTMIVAAGDHMFAEIEPTGSGGYYMEMVDITGLGRSGASKDGEVFWRWLQGETGVVAAGQTFASSEVIPIEATTVNGQYSALPQVTKVQFTECYVTSNNAWVPIGKAALGLEVDEIASNDPHNKHGLRTKTAVSSNGLIVTTTWLSSS
jgi:hypothetical protein